MRESLASTVRAELAVALAVMLARQGARTGTAATGRAHAATGFQRHCRLSGSWLGIIGMGALGQCLARRLGEFEANILYVDAARLPLRIESRLNVWRVSWRELLPVAEFIVITSPRFSAARPVIDADVIARMRPDAQIVNLAGEQCVERAAVLAAISQGRLRGYATDVDDIVVARSGRVVERR